jgi:hypothetical protein
MIGFARFLERKATFVYLILFAGIMWPPDAYFSGTMVTPQGQSNIYDFLEFALLAPFLGFGFLALRRELPRVLLVAWPVLALCLIAFLSAYWSDYPAIVVRRAGTLTLSTLFGVYLGARGDFAELVAALVKVFAIAAVASFIAIVALPQAATVTGEYYTHAWRGAFTDKNDLGLACGEAIVLSAYALKRGYGPRWLALATLAAFLVQLAGSQSKTPIVFMMAALYGAMIVLALRRRTAGGLIVGYALLVAGMAGTAILAMTWQDVLLVLGRDPTFTNRTRTGSWRSNISASGRGSAMGSARSGRRPAPTRRSSGRRSASRRRMRITAGSRSCWGSAGSGWASLCSAGSRCSIARCASPRRRMRSTLRSVWRCW